MEHPRADSERGGDAGGDGMNTLILYAMGIASGGIFGQLFHWVRYSVADGDKLSNLL